jgi:uncharacterized ion transporter superfamily protein YfcC
MEITMDQKAGAQISKKAFIQSMLILLVLMIVAGVLTLIVPAGQYDRVMIDDRESVVPDSFQFTERPDYPIWRWFTAPIEVLGSSEGTKIIVIIVFILMVGGAFAILDKSGILNSILARIVDRFGGKKYTLLLIVSFFFMALGAFFGIFEEVVPLVPLMVALSYYLGWDALVGLAMSILATNLGFSSAITNPFTIGVAQELAGLPLFSGAWFRFPIFLVTFAIYAIFIVRYAKRIEKDPTQSPVYKEDLEERKRHQTLDLGNNNHDQAGFKRAMTFFMVCVLLIVGVLVSGPFIPFLSEIALPLVGLLFLIGGVGAGLLTGEGKKLVFSALWEGVLGIAPGIILILMASSVKHIVSEGGIIDTILNSASTALGDLNPFMTVVAIYLLALVIEIFISSGSAKAFLLMPILLPLGDLVGVTRQVTVLAYCFGDGFSNLAYPTNAVLLIALGFTVVSYPKWIKWLLKLWFWIFLASLVFIFIAVQIGYGPF